MSSRLRNTLIHLSVNENKGLAIALAGTAARVLAHRASFASRPCGL